MRRRLLLVLVSLIVTVALLEVVVTLHLGDRFVRGANLGNNWQIAGRMDPDLGWSGRPNAVGRIVRGEMDYTVHLNSRGFRDVERSVEKAPGLKRVLALGDSVTWGWGVEEGERFSDLLEQRLGPDVEVLNLACPGYGTDQQYWTLVERGLEFDPDLVLLCFVINDVYEAENGTYYDMSKPRFVRGEDGTWSVEGRPVDLPADRARPPGAWDRLVMRSALLTLLTRRPLGPSEQALADETDYRAPGPRALQLVREIADRLVDPASVTRHALGLLKTACDERGIPLLVTHVPHKHDQYLYEPRFPAPEGPHPAPFRTYFTRRVEEGCAALQVPVVPVDDLFWEACRGGQRLHVGDGHPNAAGHRLIADRLEPAIRALLAHSE